MGCRCTDISNLNSEITSLNYALSQINYALDSSSNTVSKMNEVAESFESGVILGIKHHEISEDIRKKYDKAVEYINSANTAVNKALESAKSELERAKQEDNKYHQDISNS